MFSGQGTGLTTSYTMGSLAADFDLPVMLTANRRILGNMNTPLAPPPFEGLAGGIG